MIRAQYSHTQLEYNLLKNASESGQTENIGLNLGQHNPQMSTCDEIHSDDEDIFFAKKHEKILNQENVKQEDLSTQCSPVLQNAEVQNLNNNNQNLYQPQSLNNQVEYQQQFSNFYLPQTQQQFNPVNYFSNNHQFNIPSSLMMLDLEGLLHQQKNLIVKQEQDQIYEKQKMDAPFEKKEIEVEKKQKNHITTCYSHIQQQQDKLQQDQNQEQQIPKYQESHINNNFNIQQKTKKIKKHTTILNNLKNLKNNKINKNSKKLSQKQFSNDTKNIIKNMHFMFKTYIKDIETSEFYHKILSIYQVSTSNLQAYINMHQKVISRSDFKKFYFFDYDNCADFEKIYQQFKDLETDMEFDERKNQSSLESDIFSRVQSVLRVFSARFLKREIFSYLFTKKQKLSRSKRQVYQCYIRDFITAVSTQDAPLSFLVHKTSQQEE